ncbi:alpha/beta hydrolase [Nonomuraea pusilla]|uniref:Alpha/beta hydrolase fold n=1 Tax=Nonomuraea pusilla TaxID=46177 RepID=A0A1H7RRT4_9ACTN|nr:alpha/beta hydrolase [Nonomuraea pusilla]SEL62941.1 alpha/beta hydrolase fold [Nonomuraea pusilla]
MKRIAGVVAGIAVLAGGLAPVDARAADASMSVTAEAGRQKVAWGPCPKEGGQLQLADVECASVRVPLDYRNPGGRSISVAINRVKAKVASGPEHLGTLVVNPGGPGASGRKLAALVSAGLPNGLGERYDVVGLDPRGVGGSQPSLHCVDPDAYYRAPRPDAVPQDAAEERTLLDRAKHYATRCGQQWGWFLPYLTTENSARDLDVVREALGEEKISYLGYSYGTYLGAVYATLFPDRVDRMVMDSTVDPTAVWYRANLAQDRAFERRHHDFLAWTAKNNAVYHLGATPGQTSEAYYAMRDRLRSRPAGGVVGPSELDDTFTMAGYSDRLWPELAAAWSAYRRRGDAKPLVDAFNKHGKTDLEDENGYAVYLGVQCRDAAWPRSWPKWRADMTRLHHRAPFMTWPNAWFNAPCLFWPTPGGTPVKVQGAPSLPPTLMIQSRRDAATPYEGALTMRRLFPKARMVVEEGGNHGVSLAGNRCVDARLAAYLADGTLPARDMTCAAQAAPRAAAARKAAAPKAVRRAGTQRAGTQRAGTERAGVKRAGVKRTGAERLTEVLAG